MKKLGKLVLPSLLVVLFFLGLSQPAPGNSTATISVEPQIINVTVCTTFEVDIWIRNQGSMDEFMFIVTWDDTQMILDSHDLHDMGWSSFILLSTNYLNLISDGSPFANAWSWITLSFHCINEGSSYISLGASSIKLAGTNIAHTKLDGEVTQNPRYTPSYSSWVGGELTSVNKLAVLAPYLTLVGLVAAISTVYAFKKKKNV